jgi:hypothetical protein
MHSLSQRFIRRLGIALALALVPGCTMVDRHVRIEGFPQLKVIEHHLGHAEMRDNCLPYTGPFMTPAGCTLFVFDRMEAHIVVSKDIPNPAVLEHERLHAAGHDHIGSEGMKRMWLAWRARKQEMLRLKQLAPIEPEDPQLLVQWEDD